MIRQFSRFIKKKQTALAAFKNNAHYMGEGVYVFDSRLSYIYRNDAETKKNISLLFRKERLPLVKKIVIYFIKLLFFQKSYRIAHYRKKPYFSGTVFLPVRSTKHGQNQKIFDFSRKLVLLKLETEDDIREILHIHAYFKEFFPIPKIIRTDYERLFVMEELIIGFPRLKWKNKEYEDILEDMFIRYEHYFRRQAQKSKEVFSVSVSDLCKGFDCKEVNFVQSSMDQEIFNSPFPCLKLHGDLWTGNTLLEIGKTSQIKYIDWEYSNELVFFYDLFNAMWLEYHLNQNDFYIKRYLQGSYDEKMEALFAQFRLTFYKERRTDYLHAFFLCFYVYRLRFFNKSMRKLMNRQYRLLLKNLSLSGNKQKRHWPIIGDMK